MPLHGCVELVLDSLTGFDEHFHRSFVLPGGLSAGQLFVEGTHACGVDDGELGFFSNRRKAFEFSR